jgi:hypothetical protein
MVSSLRRSNDLWEPWMRHADGALNDDQLLEIVQQELSKHFKRARHEDVREALPKSLCACCCSSTRVAGASKT